jgi:hypothetical protein
MSRVKIPKRRTDLIVVVIKIGRITADSWFNECIKESTIISFYTPFLGLLYSLNEPVIIIISKLLPMYLYEC